MFVRILTHGAAAAAGMEVKTATRDNTLEEVRRRKTELVAVQNAASAAAAVAAAASAAGVQSEQKTETEYTALPPNWRAVVDPTTGQTYYWNTVRRTSCTSCA